MGTPRDRSRYPPSNHFIRTYVSAALRRYDVMLASLGLNALTLALPLVILQMYDRVIPEGSLDTFALLMTGIAIVVVIDGLLRLVRSRVTSWAAARFEHASSRRAVDRLVGAEIDAFEQSSASEHLERIAAIEQLRDFNSGQGLIALSDLPFVLVFLGLIYLIGGDLVIAPLAIAVFATVFALVLGRLLNSAIRRRAALDDERYNFIFQTLYGIHTVKGLGLEAQMVRQYQAYLGPLAKAVERVAFLSSVGQSMTTTLGNVAMVATAGLGSILVVGGSLTGGALVACILLAGRAVQPMMRMIGIWIQSRNLAIAESRLSALLRIDQESNRSPMTLVSPAQVGDIELQSATLHRGSPDYPVLDDVTLSIPKGSMVAVTGPLGGGKSSFLDMLGGLSMPDEGTVRYNGVPYRDIDWLEFRGRIGYARQDVILYRGTLAENLALFEGEERLRKALQVSHVLGLDEVIAKMPKGLDTRLGDTASDLLPGNVQQQISLARILAGSPDLLLLDEANSAFDLQTDLRFRNVLQALRGATTVVMITSRPSLIALADIVLSVERGRVLEVTEEYRRQKELSHKSADRQQALPASEVRA